MSNLLEVVVVKRTDVTSVISVFELAKHDGTRLPPYTAGAHIDVQVADGIVRQYSLLGDPKDRDRYLIAVLRETNSRGGSKGMHERVFASNVICISEPRNHFELDHSADHYVLVGGGIGITPILAMARTLLADMKSFELHYCAKSRTGAAFLDVLAESSFSDRVHTYFDDENQKLDPAGFAQYSGAQVYVCGPAGFMDWVSETAIAAGVLPDNVRREYFAAAPKGTVDNDSFEVTIQSTGQSFLIPPDKSVARVLEDAGVEILLSCEQGICGSCITTILEGLPDHRDSVLTETERQSNTIFTPCCSRAKTKRLVLDL
jgi:vanillate O-demethylase ferredoxin subunit